MYGFGHFGAVLAAGAARLLASLGKDNPIWPAPRPAPKSRYRPAKYTEPRRPPIAHSWSPFQAVVQAMPRRERQAWARLGYPGLSRSNGDLKELTRFTDTYRAFRASHPDAPVGAFVLAQFEAKRAGARP